MRWEDGRRIALRGADCSIRLHCRAAEWRLWARGCSCSWIP